ncbi:EAL domain-containing protein [Catenulispora sp. NF23]|nr:EAL domain-containing protein [Catenulispora pinistramenti]
MNLSAVAEGVGSRTQWERLELAGCEFGQGCLFSRLPPSDQVEEWLACDGRKFGHRA